MWTDGTSALHIRLPEPELWARRLQGGPRLLSKHSSERGTCLSNLSQITSGEPRVSLPRCSAHICLWVFPVSLKHSGRRAAAGRPVGTHFPPYEPKLKPFLLGKMLFRMVWYTTIKHGACSWSGLVKVHQSENKGSMVTLEELQSVSRTTFILCLSSVLVVHTLVVSNMKDRNYIN